MLQTAAVNAVTEGFHEVRQSRVEGSRRDFDESVCVQSLIEGQASKTPLAEAVVFGSERLNYGDLNGAANRLAHHLRSLGVVPDQPVGVCLDRSIEMVVALLAVLKAGGAYVPLDPGYPCARLAAMLDDARPPVVIGHAASRTVLAEATALAVGPCRIVDVDDPAQPWRGGPDHDPLSEDVGLTSRSLAYVIYTSGSTGQPKGAMIEHRSLVNYLIDFADTHGFDGSTRALNLTSISFDPSLRDILGPLAGGGSVELLSRDQARAPSAILQAVLRRDITVVCSVVPILLRSLCDEIERSPQAPSALKRIMTCGEVLKPALAARLVGLLPDCVLVNQYGPTECTMTTARYEVPKVVPPLSVPIGRPISNTRIYIVDDDLCPTPLGVAGELLIGGMGVGRGYLNQPELTRASFIESPFVAGDRLYRTGDLARFLPDGDIEYLGRRDFQLKVRGVRIEPGEIEAGLAALDDVREAVVIGVERSGGDQMLTAYVVPQDLSHPPRAETLRAQLAQRLPEAMVPVAYVILDSLPLTPNGKLDRKALPRPDTGALASTNDDPPRSATEKAVAAVWRDLLGVETVSRSDNFFSLGGHSLLAIRAVARLRASGFNVPVASFFSAGTLSRLASECTHRAADDPPSVRLRPAVMSLSDHEWGVVRARHGPELEDAYPLTPLQEGFLFHRRLAEEEDPYTLVNRLRFRDVQHLSDWLGALNKVIARHTALRSFFVWEGLDRSVQVVVPPNAAVLHLEGSEAAGSNPPINAYGRQGDGIDISRAPLMRVRQENLSPDGRVTVVWTLHHLIADHETFDILRAEIDAFLQGLADRLDPPHPYADHLEEWLALEKSPRREAFFRDMLFGSDRRPAAWSEIVTSSSAPPRQLGLSVSDDDARRILSLVRSLGVSPAAMFHLVWSDVVGAVSGAADAVFGTVLSGRSDQADPRRVAGLFINTLPFRAGATEGTASQKLRTVQSRLAQLVEHERTPLAVAQRYSGVRPGRPLFTSLLNYRHSLLPPPSIMTGPREIWTGVEELESIERSTYPVALSVDQWGENFALTLQVDPEIDGDVLMREVSDQLSSLLHQLGTEGVQ